MRLFVLLYHHINAIYPQAMQYVERVHNIRYERAVRSRKKEDWGSPGKHDAIHVAGSVSIASYFRFLETVENAGEDVCWVRALRQTLAGTSPKRHGVRPQSIASGFSSPKWRERLRLLQDWKVVRWRTHPVTERMFGRYFLVPERKVFGE